MSTTKSTSDLHEETIRFVDLLAKIARLEDRLPADTDFSPEEMKTLQDQVRRNPCCNIQCLTSLLS